MAIQDSCREIHALGFLYLASAHATDGELDAREMRVIAERLAGWAGLDDEDCFEQAIVESVELYNSCPDASAKLRKIAELTAQLEASCSRVELERVLTDLIEIASADGRVVDGEIDFVTAVAQTFGISIESSRETKNSDD